MPRKEIRFKAVVIGDSHVGKQSLVENYPETPNKFTLNYLGIQGIMYTRLEFIIDGKSIYMEASLTTILKLLFSAWGRLKKKFTIGFVPTRRSNGEFERFKKTILK